MASELEDYSAKESMNNKVKNKMIKPQNSIPNFSQNGPKKFQTQESTCEGS